MIVALVVGILGAGQPIDDYLRMARNVARAHPPSGNIVVIGIDERSTERLGAWPWPRARHAELIDRLDRAGVRRIFFDILFNAPSDRRNDGALARAIRRSGNVHLAATFTINPQTDELTPKFPRPQFQENARLISIAVQYNGLAAIRKLPYATDFHGRVIPSMASVLADVPGPPGALFPVDYAVNVRQVETISYVDVLSGAVAPSRLAGKDVVVALASRELGDLYFMPGRGLVHGAYIMVAGGETLASGRPTDLGWLAALAIGMLLSVVHLFSRRRWLGRSALLVAVGGVSVAPLIAESHKIFFDVTPAMILVVSVAVSGAWHNFRRSYKVKGDINPISGLPNLNALRGETVDDDAVLVGARVRNFAEISSSLPAEGERALVEQIANRLALGSRGARIFQGDEGIFVWTASVETAGPDQLDALHALFRSPAIVDGRPIDLSVTFGTDMGGARTLANRIGATLVAADEAAAEGLRWKAYDPAKLADAEWKLSLLGRLDAAIDTGEMWVAYQPQLDLKTGSLCGAEALVRWSHPEKGEISPMEFVLAAEQHNRIDKLTAFVLSDAIKLAAAFHARGIAFDVAVNISVRLLEKAGLVALVREQLADAKLPPERLTLEVTESAALTSDRTAIRTLEEIGSLGINVSIDDYGTGFSTLEYFKKIPATEVKIDRGFVASIDRSASDRLMVRSTIELAHSLGRNVVAEGVETKAILDELARLGCDKAQGYLIGRPMKALSLTKLILEDRRSRAA